MAVEDRLLRIPDTELVMIERRTPASRRRGAIVGGLLAGLVGTGLAVDRARNHAEFNRADGALTVIGSAAVGAAVGALVARRFGHYETLLVRSDPK